MENIVSWSQSMNKMQYEKVKHDKHMPPVTQAHSQCRN